MSADGLRLGGTKAYFSTLYEQSWVAYPLPAIYTGQDLRGYREWLPADGWEGSSPSPGASSRQMYPPDRLQRCRSPRYLIGGRGSLATPGSRVKV